MPKLFESEESADSGDETLKVNKEYAKVYEDFRHKEELQKCKDSKSRIFINCFHMDMNFFF